MTTSNFLRHVESMATLPSGAGNISHLNAVILGESLASEEDDLVFPSTEFSSQALVSSPANYLDMYKYSIDDPAGFCVWICVCCHFCRWGNENFNLYIYRYTHEFFT
ncbi:acetate--CoA ligase [Ranunculus cassubicifolius]